MRELMKQSQPDDNSRDLAAFIANALVEIHDTIDVSVEAWEKRGYWVKADRFRMEWEWTGGSGQKMRRAVLENDWATIAMTMPQIAQRFMTIQIPERHRLGTPWVGAYKQLIQADRKS
jgi:hypothetical protein